MLVSAAGGVLCSEDASDAVVSRAGARTWLQPTGHGDMEGFDSSSAAIAFVFLWIPMAGSW